MIATKVLLARRWPWRRPATARHQRVYAIGDIHGRYDLFKALIRALEEDNARRADGKAITLVVLGDFIDRGPSSQRLIRLLMSVQQRGQRLVVLMGNHEAALIGAVAGNPEAQAAWLTFGGLATLESFGIDPPGDDESADAFADRLTAGLSAEVVDWLVGLPLSARNGDYFLCHAGVRPGVALHRQKRADLLWIREPFLASKRDFGAVVVHGHTIVETVAIERNRIGLDTGAYRTGVLSAACLDGAEAWIFQTDAADGDPAPA